MFPGSFYFPKERRIHTVKVLHQKPQAKIKQHLKHLLTATAALLTATTISITALAEATWGRGNGGGATSAPSPSNQLYNMTTTNELSWKIDLVVPMAAWSETSGSGTYDYSCWEVNNGMGSINIVGGNSSYSNRLCLDSFMSAQLNLTTKTIFSDTQLASFYSEYVTITESMAAGYADRGKLRYGISNGSVYAEKYYENIASCAHDLHDSTTYCGVRTSNDVTSWTDSNMAAYGGITVYKNDIDEPDTPSIPVYYYITPNPNNPITPPSTATPPTFTPNPPPGTTVTRVAIPSDNSLTEPNNPPDDFPDPITTPYKEITPTGGTYPIDPDNPPDHILVECKETDDIPIYYHVFTFVNTTGKTYSDVFDYLADNPKVVEPTSEQVIASLPVR